MFSSEEFKALKKVVHYVECSEVIQENQSRRTYLKSFSEILKLLLKNPTAQIIYVIKTLKIASSYELSMLSGVTYNSLIVYMSRLMRYGILDEKTQYSLDYEDYIKEWKKISPKASDRTIVCIFNDNFLPVANAFEDIVKYKFENTKFEKINVRKNALLNIKNKEKE